MIGLKQGAGHRRCQLRNAEEPAAPPFVLTYNPLVLPCFVSTASSAYTGVIIGVFVAVLIVGSAAVLAKALYSSRHQICLGNFGLTLSKKKKKKEQKQSAVILF